MKIDRRQVSIRQLVEGFNDDPATGRIVGFYGQLDIRPPYQREFIYPPDKRDEVIRTVFRKFPLNTMYWVKCDDGHYELMDGQQRTVSICQYANNDFSVNFDGKVLAFQNLPSNKRGDFLNYKLDVYVCEGSDSDKLEWFRIINIAGMPLTDQEIRNAMYTGPWLSDAKVWFSKTNPPAFGNGIDKLVKGSPIRQEVLELALKWISAGSIEQYMSSHQNNPNASELWQYWQEVFDWVKRVFPDWSASRSKLMKGLAWGEFYNEFQHEKYNATNLETRISALLKDEDVVKKSGIYEFLLRRESDERFLNLRAFSDSDKLAAFEEQKGICIKCEQHFDYDELVGDHIIPWSKGGKTIAENCQMLCRQCNAIKSDK